MYLSKSGFIKTNLYLTAFLLLLCGTGPVFAQVLFRDRMDQSARKNINGYVRDAETREALPYANVIIEGTNFGAATNSDGYFVIVNAPADTCKLKVTYVGYAPQVIAVDNTRGLERPLEIKMVRRPIELEGVRVKEEVQMLDVSDQVSQVALSPEEISILPNVGEVDIFRSLQLLPGISGVNDGSSGLYIRGGTPDQNLILFDGMTIYHVDHFFGFFSAFNADAIKDIRVYKGGFPAEFGGRTSSVVNLTGKTGDVSRRRYGLGLNLLSGHGLVEIPLSDKLTFLLSARRSYTDVVRSSLYNKLFDFVSGNSESRTTYAPGQGIGKNPNLSLGTENPDFYFFDVNTKVTYNPTAKDIFSLSIYNGRDNLGQFQDLRGEEFEYQGVNSVFQDPKASLTTGQLTEWGNFGISGKWSRKMNDRFYTHLLVSHSNYFSKYDLNRTFNSTSGIDSLNFIRGASMAAIEDNEVKDLTIRLDNEFHLSNFHDLKLGLGFSRLNTHYFSTINDTTQLVSRETEAMNSSLYVQDLWKITQSIELTAGLRGTYYEKTSSSYLEPRASFIYSLSNNFQLKGAWGHYHQFVNRIANENVLEGSRDFWILADKDLKPSFAEHWILGATCQNADYLLDLEGYWKDLDNVVEYSRRASYNIDILGGGAGVDLLKSAGFFQGSGYARGVDVLLQKKTGRLNGWIGYSFGKVRHKFPDLNHGQPFPASHDRKHEVNVVSKLSLKNWDLSATFVFASGKAYTAPESQYFIDFLDGTGKSYIHVSDKNNYRLPAYHRLDLSISRNFETRSATYVLGLSVFNLYNRHNLWYRQFNLDTVPVAVTDVQMLSFTPTVYIQVYSR